jgi:hypothetical protein
MGSSYKRTHIDAISPEKYKVVFAHKRRNVYPPGVGVRRLEMPDMGIDPQDQ